MYVRKVRFYRNVFLKYFPGLVNYFSLRLPLVFSLLFLRFASTSGQFRNKRNILAKK